MASLEGRLSSCSTEGANCHWFRHASALISAATFRPSTQHGRPLNSSGSKRVLVRFVKCCFCGKKCHTPDDRTRRRFAQFEEREKKKLDVDVDLDLDDHGSACLCPLPATTTASPNDLPPPTEVEKSTLSCWEVVAW